MISYSSVFSSKVIFLHRAHRFLFACLRPFCILVTHFKFDCVSVRKGVFRARIKQRSAILVSRITGIYDCPAWPTRASFLNSSPLWLFLTMRSYLVICASLPVWKLKCFLKYETVEKKKRTLEQRSASSQNTNRHNTQNHRLTLLPTFNFCRVFDYWISQKQSIMFKCV